MFAGIEDAPRRVFWSAAIALSAVASMTPAPVGAVTSESPEVTAMVDRGLRFLESNSDERLGGKCLIGLAFHKRGFPSTHPAIRAALDACRNSLETEKTQKYLYSKALAVIFLIEMGDDKLLDLAKSYAELMEVHQMQHGGFGYAFIGDLQGDTSQTQYASLAYWEMVQAGLAPPASSVERCVNWVLRTQDPDGGWAYKGNDPGDFKPSVQSPISPCMASAGLSSLLIGGNMLGELKPKGTAQSQDLPDQLRDKLPPALKRDLSEKRRTRVAATLKATGAVDRNRMLTAAARGRAWIAKNFDPNNGGHYPHYFLYALERYKSFEEYIDGEAPAEPDWYQKGYELLKTTQQPDGSWQAYGDSSAPTSTAFSILFLIRSTQASIKARLGEGTLVGGRGLPRDLSRLKLRDGRLVVDQPPTEIDNLLEALEASDEEDVGALAASPDVVLAGTAGPQQARRLEQISKSGQPDERLVAVRALGQLRSVDHAPALIFALSDPDRRVVRAARDALQSASRSFEGYGPPDEFDESQRAAALERWKAWYGRVRPDAPPLP